MLGLAEAVESGIGIGPLPCFIADVRPALVRLTPPEPDFSTGRGSSPIRTCANRARVRAFMDFAAGEIAKQRRMIEGLTAFAEDEKKRA